MGFLCAVVVGVGFLVVKQMVFIVLEVVKMEMWIVGYVGGLGSESPGKNSSTS